jgi:hypothetical protein
VPIGRIVQGQPAPVDDLAVREGAEQPVGQEQLGGVGGRLLRPGRARGEPVLVQAPGGRERLMERRAAAAGPQITVPATVGLLPVCQRLGE